MAISPSASPSTQPNAVVAVRAARSEIAERHFAAKLSLETDPSDLHAALQAGATGIAVVDARAPEHFARGHIPGAISLPYQTIDDCTVRDLRGKDVVVVYCWGVSCNAATKAAVRLARLGLPMKELIGGVTAWRAEGYTLAGEVATAT